MMDAERSGEKAKLVLIAGKNAESKTAISLAGYSSTVVQKVFSSGNAIVLAGTDEAEAIGSESAVLNNLRSIMAVPLKVGAKTIGVVYLDSRMASGLFVESDLNLLTAICNQISVSFELMRLAKVEIEKANLQKELEIEAAIAEESKKIKILVDNMRQALFAVDNKGLVVEPVSKFTENVFGEDIVGKDGLGVLYKEFEAKKDVRDLIRGTFLSVMGEDDLQWSLEEHNFPRKVRFATKGISSEEQKILKVVPSPIWDKNNQVEKILFVVEDFTELEALESKLGEQSKSRQMLEEIVSSNVRDFREFIAKVIVSARDLITNLNQITPGAYLDLLRELHTFKGVARYTNAHLLAAQIHESETILAELDKSQLQTEDFKTKLALELTNIEKLSEQYVLLFKKISTSGTDETASHQVNDQAFKALSQTVSSLTEKLTPRDSSILKLSIERLNYRSISEVANKFKSMVSEISNQLNKKVDFSLVGNAFINPVHFSLLEESLVHLIRNSLDHGLETPDERREKGKPEIGKIRIECEDSELGLKLKVVDDGRGINPKIIERIAIKKGILSEEVASKMSKEEIINLIFVPEFSTKENATDVSGRGIGMDAVKNNISKMKGTIDLSSEVDEGTTTSISINL